MSDIENQRLYKHFWDCECPDHMPYIHLKTTAQNGKCPTCDTQEYSDDGCPPDSRLLEVIERVLKPLKGDLIDELRERFEARKRRLRLNGNPIQYSDDEFFEDLDENYNEDYHTHRDLRCLIDDLAQGPVNHDTDSAEYFYITHAAEIVADAQNLLKKLSQKTVKFNGTETLFDEALGYAGLSKTFCEFRDVGGYTSSGFTGPAMPECRIFKHEECVAYVSYNGRVWKGSQYEPNTTPIYDPRHNGSLIASPKPLNSRDK